MLKRIETGITSKNGKLKLDDYMKGGIPEGNVVLVTGSTGTSKSNFCYQVTAHQAAQGKVCYYVAFDQTKEDIIENAKSVGVNLEQKNIFIQTYVDLKGDVINELLDKIADTKDIDFLVLDSVASISGVMSESEFHKLSQVQLEENYVPQLTSEARVVRRVMRRLILAIKKKKPKITALLVNELPEGTKKLSKDDESDFIVDGVIVMYYVPIGEDEKSAFRSMRIRKMRKTSHKKGIILFSLNNKGIVLEEDPMNKVK